MHFKNSNLKFQISNLNFEIHRIFRRPSTDHPTTARREKTQRKTKCVSNDRSRHDDQFCPKIVKIGAILDYFWPLQSLRLPRLISHGGVVFAVEKFVGRQTTRRPKICLDDPMYEIHDNCCSICCSYTLVRN